MERRTKHIIHNPDRRKRWFDRPRFRADRWYNSALCPSPTGFWLVGKLEGEYQPSVEDLLCEWEVITAEGLKHEEPF